MDLRWRLLGSLGMLLTGLMLMAIAINLYSLKGDIRNEIAASENLARVLLEASRMASETPAQEVEAQLSALLQKRPLRHLTLAVSGMPPPGQEESAFLRQLALWLGFDPAPQSGQDIRLGGQILRIAANPTSEIEERLTDTLRLCITLALFSAATLAVAWWSAHRALAPVRELERGLQRLARGEDAAALPAFALKEFRRVAAAIDELAAALAASHAAQHHLARQLISAREKERASLARELHDNMGQSLTAISATAGFLERHASELDAERVGECARDLRRDVRASREQLRTMLRSLRPHGLDIAGLPDALEELLDHWRQRSPDVGFRLEIRSPLPDTPEAACLALYRIAQEALTNTVRHSKATTCLVALTGSAEYIELRVEDNGTGPPQSGITRGTGLLGMEERLAMVAGRLWIGNTIPRGFALCVTIPLPLSLGEAS